MNFFDRIAERISSHVARAWFFCLCLLIVILWLPSLPLFGSVDTWQLVINTATTIITFLLVALLQNDQRQFENAVHHKLDAQSNAILALVRKAGTAPAVVEELRRSIGSEKRIGSD